MGRAHLCIDRWLQYIGLLCADNRAGQRAAMLAGNVLGGTGNPSEQVRSRLHALCNPAEPQHRGFGPEMPQRCRTPILGRESRKNLLYTRCKEVNKRKETFSTGRTRSDVALCRSPFPQEAWGFLPKPYRSKCHGPTTLDMMTRRYYWIVTTITYKITYCMGCCQ